MLPVMLTLLKLQADAAGCRRQRVLLPSVPMAMPMDDELVNPEKVRAVDAVDDVVEICSALLAVPVPNRHAAPP